MNDCSPPPVRRDDTPMDPPPSNPPATAEAPPSEEAAMTAEAAARAADAAARAVSKRYETLATIRTKAIRGKGAWYWAHLEPFLVLSDSGMPKAVKLRCSLCDATFSASNPSRTSTDHLKKGSCPNYSPSSSHPTPPPPASSSARPISSAPPFSRKRPSSKHARALSLAHARPDPPPLMLPCPSSAHHHPHQPVVLSGGKEDLGALAMLEDSVKRLKSPKASPGPPLHKPQADAAVSLLAEWVFESCGSVSIASLTHPKFREFLHQVGLPAADPRRILGPLLDSRFRDAAADSDAKIRDAAFFQLSSSGWRKQQNVGASEEHRFVILSANLPNGTTVFHRAVLTVASAPSDYAEEVFRDAVNGLMGGIADRCAGIVADRFRSKALVNLENRHHWMVNISCQAQAIAKLINDFARELPLFETAVANCFKLASYFNKQSQVRSIFHRYQLQESDRARLLRAPIDIEDAMANFGPVYSMLEDVMGSIGPLQLTVLDQEYKAVCGSDREAVELAELIQDMRFWRDAQAVHSIVRLIKDMASDMEVERPLIGQCLPLWNELRAKVSDWGIKFSIELGAVDKLIERRFKKNYHPAWAAAFILDPVYLIKDVSGKYLPPFQLLTPEQEKDVDKLITRLVSREEAHIALMELMKWRTEGLDPLYAQAVQVKQPDPATGKMKIANPQSSRLVWETCLSELKTLGKVAVRLIFLHATASCGLSPSPPVLRWISGHPRSRTAMERAEKMVSIAAHAKFDRREFSSEEKDAEILDEGGDDMVHDAFAEAPPSL